MSQGEDRYRRGLYTFMKRTAPYAMFNTFDAPSGEECVARRDVSDTPLQALTLLNDTVFEEVDQALGRLAASDPSKEIAARVDHLFERILCRLPAADERQIVLKFYETQKQRVESKELDARKIAGPAANDPVECAAWAATARALLNLDETITKN